MSILLPVFRISRILRVHQPGLKRTSHQLHTFCVHMRTARSILRKATVLPRSTATRHLHQRTLPALVGRNVEARWKNNSFTHGGQRSVGHFAGEMIRPPANTALTIVPEQQAYIVERLGKYRTTLHADWYILIPFLDKIAYVHSLKEQALVIDRQSAITSDNVTISMDGILYVQVVDPFKASYGVDDVLYAVTQLAQTTMRSEIGKMTLDKTFKERDALNMSLVAAINQASEAWGLRCLRYEIRDISPPASVRDQMHMQAEAVRRKRAQISESEGVLQSDINLAEGQKQALELKAAGEATAIYLKAKATADAVDLLSNAVSSSGGEKAIGLRIAEQYIEAFGKLAKESTTLMLPSNAGDPSAMVAQAMGLYSALNKKGEPQKGSSGEVAGAVDGEYQPYDEADDEFGHEHEHEHSKREV